MTSPSMQSGDRQSRRHFFQLAGLGAAAIVAGHGEAAEETNRELGHTAGPKLPFELGLASYTLRKFPLDKTLAMTRRVGLKYLCLKSFHLPLESTPQQIAEAVARVKAAGLVLYGGGVISMANEAEVNHAFEYARAAGMTTIIASPAPKVLPLVEKNVKEYDLRVAIHNHGPGDKEYPTPHSIHEKVRGLDPRIGICMDIGHTARIGADPIESAEKYADRLHDIHIKDVSAAAPRGTTVEVGRGVIDIPRFLAILIRINYRGVVSFEHEKDESDPLPGLAESVGYVRGSLATIRSRP